MATSLAELERLRALVRDLADELDNLISVEKREQDASRKLGEPRPRTARIP